MKYSLLVVMAFLFVFVGCYNEDDIHVTEGLEVSYSLPQGDHPYDTTIMNWYEQYGFYTLYIFENKDIYWANTNWEERLDEGGGGNLRGNPADPNYVGELIDILEQGLINVYPDSLITNYMPLKVLLCMDLWNVLQGGGYDWDLGEYVSYLDSTKIWAYEGWDYIAVNGGSETMRPISDEEKAELQAAVNSIFLQRLYEGSVLEIPEEFGEVSDYSTQGYYTAPTIFEYGFVRDNPLGNFSAGTEVMIEEDFESYIPLLARPLSWLEAEPGELYEYDVQYNQTLILKGVFNRDVNGLIRQKYNILMDMLEEKGIDIQQLQNPVFD